MGKFTAVSVAAALVLVGCTAGDDDPSTTAEESPAPATTVLTGPAPGVTADAVRVGLTFVDTDSLTAAGVDLDLGDIEGAYRALVDEINADGGIHGRLLDPVFTPINPIGSEGAEAACVELAEDEEVFIAAGLFLYDDALCLVETHETAVIGGGITAERLERATVPWFTPEAGSDLNDAAIAAMAESGEMDGPVAVLVDAASADYMEDDVLPLLDELGVDVVESAVQDAPAEDPTAVQARVRTIAERFDSSGAESVLLLSGAGLQWTTAMADQPYRPRLLFPQSAGVDAFLQDQSQPDRSLLEDALAGGPYGPNQAAWEESAMQDCIAVLEAAGLEVPAPDEVEGEGSPFLGAFQACPTMALLSAVLEAAGPELNYGTLQAAGDTLGEVAIPGDPGPRIYGPGTAADGDPRAYLYAWDADTEAFVRIDD